MGQKAKATLAGPGSASGCWLCPWEWGCCFHSSKPASDLPTCSVLRPLAGPRHEEAGLGNSRCPRSYRAR